MGFLEIYGIGAAAILGFMATLWIVSLILRNSSIVDIFWGTGFVVTAWIYFYLTPDGFVTRKLLVASLATLWGLRLSIYILIRNWGHGEDFRYQIWRQESGKNWWWFSFFKVFALQGFLMWVISIALLVAQFNPLPARLIWLDYFGLLVWAIGFYFEAVGDWPLRRFKANPDNQGKLLNTGVWGYTRHPNYFGDAAQWWCFYLIAAAAGGFWSVFSPIIMTLLLLNVSGVSMLEKTLKTTKPGYQVYVETTNAFIPWFQKKTKLYENGS